MPRPCYHSATRRDLHAAVAVLWLITFAAGPVSGAELSGRVDGLVGNDHVLVRAVGSTTYRATTRVAGVWNMPQVAAGRYTVTPIHARYRFEPPHVELTVAEDEVRELIFTAALRTHDDGAGSMSDAQHVGDECLGTPGGRPAAEDVGTVLPDAAHVPRDRWPGSNPRSSTPARVRSS